MMGRIVGERGDGISGGQKQVHKSFQIISRMYRELLLHVVYFEILRLLSWMNLPGKQ